MQRPDLRSEHDSPCRQIRKVDRLDPVTIAGDHQLAAALIPDGTREHAVEAAEQLLPPLLPAVDEHFGIRVVGSEDMPGAL